MIGDGLEKLGNMASVTVKGDPSYKIKGHSMVVLVRYWIPGKMSGTYPITFTRPDEEFTLNIKLPPFIQDGEALHMTVDSITYNFTLEQNLKFKLAFGTIPLVPSPECDVVDSHKVVTYAQVNKQLGTSDCLLQIPVAKSTEKILDYKVKAGVSSATVWWASPNVLLKGTVKVYNNNQLIAQKTEPSFTTSHQIPFTGLTGNTKYRFVMTSIDSQGNITPEMVAEATTLKEARHSFENITKLTYNWGTFTLTPPVVTTDTTSATLTWSTNVPASTEVFLGLSSDFAYNYVNNVKKGVRNPDGSYSNITIAKGYIDSTDKSVSRVFETNHSITLTELEPGTTYYYRATSYLYYNENNKQIISSDTAGSFLGSLQYVGTFTTKQAPLLHIRCVKAANNQSAKNVPVLIGKQGEAGQVYYTDSNGYIPQIVAERGKVYTIAVKDNPYYKDNSTTFSVTADQSGLLPLLTLGLQYKTTPGGYVYDSRGNPVAGATITAAKGTQTKTATTDATGFFTFDGDWLGQGSYTLTVQKDGYKTGTLQAVVDAGGIFTAKPAALKSTSIVFNITARSYNNQPLKNASVKIKEGNITKYTGQTNASGNATAVLGGYTDANAHTFTIEVIPADKNSHLNPLYLPSVITMTSFADDVNTLRVVCQANTNPPVVSNAQVTRVINALEVYCEFDIVGTQYYIKHTKPDGTSTTTPFAIALLNSNNKPHARKTFDMTGQAYGVHTFTIYAKDMYNTTTYEVYTLQKDWQKLNIASGPVIWPKVEPGIGFITITWPAWYKEAEFGKYVIQMEKPVKTIEVTEYTTTSYKLTGLTPGDTYSGTFKVYDKAGNMIYSMQNPSRFFGFVGSIAPTISNVSITPNPAGTNQEIQFLATVSDPDTNITHVNLVLQEYVETTDSKGNLITKMGKTTTLIDTDVYNTKTYQVSHSFICSEPGKHKLILKATGASPNEFTQAEYSVIVQQGLDPSTPKISIEGPNVSLKQILTDGYLLKINIVSVDAESETIKAVIDWGDGNIKEEIIERESLSISTTGKEGSPDFRRILSGSVSAKYYYQKPGVYVITVYIQSELKGKKLQSQPVRLEIRVTE